MTNLWDQPGVPHKGWEWVSITDLEESIGQCSWLLRV